MKKLLLLIVAVSMLWFFSYADIETGSIVGTVVLEDGSRIPGVSVTLTGTVLGKKTTITSEEGNYTNPARSRRIAISWRAAATSN